MRPIILLLLATVATVAGCHPGPGPSPEAQPAPQAQPVSMPIRTADLTGALNNIIPLATLSADSQIEGSATYAVTLPSAGTLVLNGAKLDAASCADGAADQRLLLRTLDASGLTTALMPLELYVPLSVEKATRYELDVYASAAAKCAAAGAVRLVFALHFFPANAVADAPGSAPGTPPSPTSPTTPTQPTTPGLPGAPQPPTPPSVPPLPTPGPAPSPAPAPVPPPAPVPVPTPPPSPCPSLAGLADDAVPPPLRARLTLKATLSDKDGCRETASWRLADVVSRPEPPACAAPEVVVAVAEQTSGSRLVKISETHNDNNQNYSVELAWVLAPDAPSAARLVSQLTAGDSVPLTPADDACAADANNLVLTDPDSWLIFRGDPRDACTDGEPAGPSVKLTEAVDSRGAPAGLAVSYRYGSASDYAWTLSYSFAATPAVTQIVNAGTPLEIALYSRRAHAYLGAWTPVARGNFPTGTLTVTDADELRRLLPHQQDVEVVLRPPTPVGGACQPRLVYAYDQAFLDAARDAAFSDQTHPGKSRFLLKESDLPP